MRILAAALALSVIAGACSSDPDVSPSTTALAPVDAADTEPLAIVASSPSEVAVGSRRLLFGLRSGDGSALESVDRAVEAEFYRPDRYEEAAFSLPLRFVWMVEGVRGVYEAVVEFDEPGLWGVRLLAADLEPSLATPFQVLEQTSVPDVGAPAPPSVTLTSADADLASITTDADPNPDFYAMSVSEAVTSGRPSVLVFATPAFCQTAACGPMLDLVKAEAAGYDDVNFVHIEVYDLSIVDVLTPVPAISEWGLPSEPWVFVVDEAGIIAARFEGVMDAEGLRSALSAVR